MYTLMHHLDTGADLLYMVWRCRQAAAVLPKLSTNLRATETGGASLCKELQASNSEQKESTLGLEDHTRKLI